MITVTSTRAPIAMPTDGNYAFIFEMVLDFAELPNVRMYNVSVTLETITVDGEERLTVSRGSQSDLRTRLTMHNWREGSIDANMPAIFNAILTTANSMMQPV